MNSNKIKSQLVNPSENLRWKKARDQAYEIANEVRI